LIRLCSFNLNGMLDKKKEDEFIQKKMEGNQFKQTLENKIKQAKANTDQEMIENIEEISYNNKTVPLKTEKMKSAFKELKTIQSKISQVEDGMPVSQVIPEFNKLVMCLDDTQNVIKKEKQEESKKSEATGQVYNVLLNYI